MNTPQNQGWRSGKAPKKQSGNKKSRDWRRDKARSGGSNIRWARILKVGSGVAGILLLLVLLALMWFFSDKHKTSVVALGPRDYPQLDLSIKTAGSEELAADWTAADAKDIQEYITTDSEAADFDVPTGKGTAVFFLNAVALPDETGSTMTLYEGVSQADKPGSGSKLSTTLGSIKKWKGYKLVLIDISQVRTNWRLGAIASDFLPKLTDQVDKKTILFTSADIGEKSWSSERFGGRTAFAHYVRKGLHGYADANEDKAISARELVEYVQNKTTAWVERNREVSPGQHPQSIPESSELVGELDFILARVNTSKLAELESESQSTDSQQASLVRKWKALEQLGPAWRDAPLQTTAVQYQLQRAAEFLSLGRMDAFDEADKKAADWLSVLQSRRPASDYFEPGSFLHTNLSVRWNTEAKVAKPDENQAIPLPENVIERNIGWFNGEHTENAIGDAERLSAIQLQKVSEESVAAGFRNVPFITSFLDKADVLRRAEHDQLFTSVRESEAGKAETAYKEATDAAGIFSTARESLQDAVHSLPALSWFVANQTANGATQTQVLDYARDQKHRDLFFPTPGFYAGEPEFICSRTRNMDASLGTDNIPGQVSALFAETRALRHQFAGKWNNDPSGMKVLGERVQTRLASLQNVLIDRARQLAGADYSQPTPEDRSEIVGLLELPFLPADTRGELLKDWMEIEKEMALEEVGTATTQDKNTTQTQMLDRREWTSFWMLQVLSLAEDGSVGVGNEPLLEVRATTQWKDAADDWVSSGRKYDQLVKLGQFGREQFTRLRDQVKEDVKAGRGTSDLEQRRRLLARADYRARFLHPIDAASLETDPAEHLTELNVAEMALYYGHRTWHDFWRVANAEGEPDWYGEVIKSCLNISRSRSTETSAEHKQLEQLADQSTIQLARTEAVEFAQSDGFKPLNVALGEVNIPEGNAAIWLVPSTESPSVKIRSNGLPLAVRTGASQTLMLDRSGGASNCRKGALGIDLFFRGHRLSSEAMVDPCSAPSSVVTLVPPSPTGSIKVQGKAERSIVFVLDWSLSMKEDEGPSNKWKTAIEKLDAVINQLEDDDEVALVLFGHRVKYVGDNRYESRRTFNFVDGRRPRATAAGMRSDYQTVAKLTKKRAALRPSSPTQPETIRDWLTALVGKEEYWPYGNTPMFGAIHWAHRLVERDGGAIVVITDGAADDPQAVSGLQQKLKSNVAASVILFGFNNTKNQRLIEDNGMQTLPARNNPAALAAQIERAIPARDFSVTSGSTFSRDVPLGKSATGLLPAEYLVRSGRNTSLDGIRIRGGELHLFKIVSGDLTRVRPEQPKNPVLVQAQRKGDPTLMGHTTFEIEESQAEITMVLDHENELLPIRWPAEISFQLAPKGGDPVKNMSVTAVSGRAIPTWRISTGAWPASQPDAIVTAFWKMEPTIADYSIPWARIAGGGNEATRAIPGKLPKLVVTGRGTAPNLTVRIDVQGIVAGDNPLKDLRVELGEIDGQFKAQPLQVVRKLWPEGKTAEFTFTVPEGVPENLTVSITSGASLRNGAVVVETDQSRAPTSAAQ